MEQTSRYAVYYVPGRGTALERLGSSLLGRDIHTGGYLTQPDFRCATPDELFLMTRAARRYGLHATLKPPFFLKPGMAEENLVQAAEEFARARKPFLLPGFRVDRIGSFFALTMQTQTEAETVRLLAREVVSFFDAFRAPPSDVELERRREKGLTPRQEGYLLRWGYPYVFDEFRFHVTLTDGIRQPDLAAALEAELRLYMAPAVHDNRVDAICICRSDPDGNFTVLHRADFPQGHNALRSVYA